MLTGNVALITGGSRGIGAACARKLAALGADIAVVYAGNAEKANEVCTACEALGVRARAYQCNVADFDAVKQTVAAVKADACRPAGQQRRHHARRSCRRNVRGRF